MDLVKKAEDFIAKFDLDTACKFYERALQMEERNNEIMTALAAVQLERGDVDTAEKLLRASISVVSF